MLDRKKKKKIEMLTEKLFDYLVVYSGKKL